MNAFFDMHVHSKFSIDGVSTMEDYCLIAEKSGIRAICFTEHVDFNSEEKNLSIVKTLLVKAKHNQPFHIVPDFSVCKIDGSI